MRRVRKVGLWMMVLLALLGMAGSGFAARMIPRAASLPGHVHPAVVADYYGRQQAVLQVIVGRDANARGVEEAAERLGIRVTDRWPFINAFAARVPITRLAKLAGLPGVRMVLPDQPVGLAGEKTSVVDDSSLVNAYNYAVKADKVWARGYNGKGVTVAVVDSGIAGSGKTDFGSRVIQSLKFNSTALYASDKYGHGTHVAGIIAGDGTNSRGKYIGIAPGANLINVKFSDDAGRASEKDLVNALQWVHDNRKKFNIRVVNLSANSAVKSSYKESPVAAAVEQLWFAGIVVVTSAGNHGTEECSVCYAPGNDPYVISVGAVDDGGSKGLSDDFVKTWSSRGTTMDGHPKPDIMAPGARIVSYMPTGDMRTQSKQNVIDSVYFRMGGTSMAAPIVAGAVAMLLQARPELTPDQVKWLLMNTARPYLQQPAGSPGIVAADQIVSYDGTPPSANQGLTPSPLIASVVDANLLWSNTYWSITYWSNTYWSNSLSY